VIAPVGRYLKPRQNPPDRSGTAEILTNNKFPASAKSKSSIAAAQHQRFYCVLHDPPHPPPTAERWRGASRTAVVRCPATDRESGPALIATLASEPRISAHFSACAARNCGPYCALIGADAREFRHKNATFWPRLTVSLYLSWAGKMLNTTEPPLIGLAPGTVSLRTASASAAFKVAAMGDISGVYSSCTVSFVAD